MAIYEVTADRLRPISHTSFNEAGLRERNDLQRLLREQVQVISPDTMVIAEEFGEWEESRRRIDLLGLDRDANLIVIELKRTDDGGHMDLQAIRYAAMISTMTFEQVVSAHVQYLRQLGHSEDDARSAILEFLGWDEPDEEQFGQEVRIVLAAADFSKELTTAVMWLNERDLDVRCVRLRPHRDGDRLLLDVQQVISLPEMADYQVRVREKQQRERESRRSTRDFSRYDLSIAGERYENLPKRRMMHRLIGHLLEAGESVEDIIAAVPWRRRKLLRIVDGDVDAEAFVERVAKQAEAEGVSFEPKRYFCKDEELVHVDGRTIAIINQWGRRTLEAVDNLAQAFPRYQISCQRSDASD